MRSRRPLTSFTLLGGAVLLLVAIAVGQRLGDSVLRQATEQRGPDTGMQLTPVPFPSPEATAARNWKNDQVVSVATDPAFPDPRATPPPTPPPPPPTARPTPAPPTSEPTIENDEPDRPAYTSPPLPLPIRSHAPEEIDTEPPDSGGYPQGIPPVTPPETPEPTPPR